VDPLKGTCVSKVKANAVKQEFEKQDELKRSAMRAFLALLAIPDAGIKLMTSNLFKLFIIQIFIFPLRQKHINDRFFVANQDNTRSHDSLRNYSKGFDSF